MNTRRSLIFNQTTDITTFSISNQWNKLPTFPLNFGKTLKQQIFYLKHFSSFQSCRKSKMLGIFAIWKFSINFVFIRKVKERMSIIHYNVCILRKVWTAWTKDTQRRRKKATSMQKAEQYHDMKILHLAMTQWKVWCPLECSSTDPYWSLSMTI